MRNQLCKIIGINDSYFDKILDSFCNNHLSIDAFIFYISTKYKLNDTKLNDLKVFLNLKVSIHDFALANPPLISIIIPTHNRKYMLIECIESVLNQSYKNVEIIIIDDCSNDGTDILINTKYIHFENIKYIRNSTNKNCGYNRNLGFNISNGEYIIFLDDDDYYLDKDYFYKAINKHKEVKDLSFVCANSFIHNVSNNNITISKINISGLIDSKEYMLNFQTKYKKPTSTFPTVFKKIVLEKADFKNMAMMNDTTIYLRALLYGRVYIFEDIIGVYRIHGNNISDNLSVDFIINNLEEKMFVFKQVKNRKENKIGSEWISMQLWITISYYISGSKPDYKAISKLLKWYLEKGDEVKPNLYDDILKLFYLQQNKIK